MLISDGSAPPDGRPRRLTANWLRVAVSVSSLSGVIVVRLLGAAWLFPRPAMASIVALALAIGSFLLAVVVPVLLWWDKRVRR